MKKFFGLAMFALLAFTLVSIQVPEEADAQPTHSKQCCDGYGIIRCRLINWTPLGNDCFCPGQGWGYAC